MKTKNKEKIKIFECKNHCEEQYIDLVVLGCSKCIKKFAPMLTKKQLEEISKIICPK
jgi:hypothetical protein